MKRFAFLITTVFSTLFFFGCEKEETVTAAELPQQAKDFISTHFGNATIVSVEKEKEISHTSFDVVLNNGTTLDFNSSGECTDIDGKTTPLPASVIPAKILDYVQTQYPTDSIVSWEKDGQHQEVQLGNNLELKFDLDGNFLSLDN
ncbi:MAG: PepSY-like domain-containing protein [Bacteroidota bacterium]|nr:PepSY-like domain-containing protein [Bacteroidota bacterium]